MSIQVMLLICALLSFMLIVLSLVSWHHRSIPPPSHVDVGFGVSLALLTFIRCATFTFVVSKLLGLNLVVLCFASA
jgi:hypothetical protein